MLIRRCDKCGKVREKEDYRTFTHYSSTNYYVSGHFDLCEDCARKLNEWFKGSEKENE